MLQRTPRPRRDRRAVAKSRRARRGYSRRRRNITRPGRLMISILTIPAGYQEDGFWFSH